MPRWKRKTQNGNSKFFYDVIRIPDDTQGVPPYLLTQGDKHYVLTHELTVLRYKTVKQTEYSQYIFIVAGYTPCTMTVAQLKTATTIAF